MTINNTTSFVVAQGNGATTAFNYAFLIPDASEVAVFFTDINGVTTQIPSTAFSISGINNPAGGIVTYPLIGSPIPVGTTLAIVRSLALVQLTTISNQGGFYPKVVETALDYLTMLIQQINARVSGFPIPPPVSSSIPWAIAAGTANVITAVYSPVNTVLSNGLVLSFRAALANTTTTPSFSPDTLTAAVITKWGGQPLGPGDIQPGGEYLIRYNFIAAHWELYNPADNDAVNWVVAGGSADAITAVYAPPNLALSDGLQLSFRALATNATTTPTFAPDGLTAHPITKFGGTALVPGDIPAALFEAQLRYNLAHTRWELQNPANPLAQDVDPLQSFINVKLAPYNAKGDGATDDTAAIQAAINAAYGVTGVFIPSGIYHISSALTITNSLEITGAGNLNSVIFLTNTSQDGFDVTTPLAVYFHDFGISAGGSQIAGYGIQISAAAGNSRSFLDNLRFFNLASCIRSITAQYATITNCEFNNFSTYGIQWDDHANVGAGDNVFANNLFINAPLGGQTNILINSGSGFRIIGNKFLGGTWGVDINTATGAFPGAGTLSDFLIEGNSIENQQSGGITIRQTDNSKIFNVNIVGNQFNSRGYGVLVQATAGITWLKGLVINSNVFNYNFAPAVPVIDLAGAQVVTVIGNTILGNAVTVPTGLAVKTLTDTGKSSLNTTLNVTTPFSNAGATNWTNT